MKTWLTFNLSLDISAINNVGKNCPKLTTFKVVADFDGKHETEIDWSLFKNLKVSDYYY